MDKTIIPFFGGLRFLQFNAHPRCRARLSTGFPFYALNFGRSGHMEWGIEGEPVKPAPFPALFWTVPGVRYRYGATGKGHWDHAYVTFEGPRVGEWIQRGLLPEPKRGGLRPVQDGGRVGQTMARLQQVLGSVGGQPEEAVWLLEGLLLELNRPATPDGDMSARKVREIARDLAEDPVADRDWPAVAAHCGLSTVHFRRRFRAEYGVAPHQYLLDARLHRGARHLRQGESLSAASTAAGFPDVFYFSRMFRKKFGIPPARYRRQHELGR